MARHRLDRTLSVISVSTVAAVAVIVYAAMSLIALGAGSTAATTGPHGATTRNGAVTAGDLRRIVTGTPARATIRIPAPVPARRSRRGHSPH